MALGRLSALDASGLGRAVVVPRGMCLLTAMYRSFLNETGLRAFLQLELGRKRFQDMRWEEIWDASLRIRNAFVRAELPEAHRRALEQVAAAFPTDAPLVVRSSAPGEDSLQSSFAGLHESFVGVRGFEALADAVRGVWASLWSDRALLYRQELGLDVSRSVMAVVVQELVMGEASGVAFSVSPTDSTLAVVEAVWGLNQGLVDGEVEPDRWTLERATGTILHHDAPDRRRWWRTVGDGGPGSVAGGGAVEDLPPGLASRPPLDDADVRRVYALARRLEDFFGKPQDVEWTIRAGTLYLLQARPISTLAGKDSADSSGDERGWYVSLHRSFANLKRLRQTIEEEELPAMAAEADLLQAVDLARLSDDELAAELEKRREAVRRWTAVYWRDFIPFAHGMRLFGAVYNDVVKPSDPYEFVDLLSGGDLLSVERNRELSRLADMLAALPARADSGPVSDWAASAGLPPAPGLPLGSGLPLGPGLPPKATRELDAYLDRFGSGRDAPPAVRHSERGALVRLLREMHTRTAFATGVVGASEADGGRKKSAAAYLDRFTGEERRFQEELLDLARASYRLRDDDNLYLDRLEAALRAAEAEAAERSAAGRGAFALAPEPAPSGDPLPATATLTPAPSAPAAPVTERSVMRPSATAPGAPAPAVSATPVMPDGAEVRICARQLVGQPAGPGLAVGPARVILTREELFDFKAGEVLVCDALEPTMTFVAPLAAAVVERRGGMLVHGAIIAREYGLPCVTGIPAATELIETGDRLTVDGYLGIVVVDRSGANAECSE